MADEAILNGNNTNSEESLESIIVADDVKEDRLTKLEEANKKLFARAKAAEEKAKAKVETPQLQTKQTNDSLTREEAILIAQGTDPKSLELLSKISKIEGVSLLEAKNSEIYLAYLAKNEQELKSTKSKLGASKGSGRIETQKTSGLTREEHMAMFKEKMGN